MSADEIKSRLNHLTDDEKEVLLVICQNPGINDGGIAGDHIDLSQSQIRNLRLSALATLRPYTPEDFCPYLLGTVQDDTVIEPPPSDPIQEFILGAQRTEPDIPPTSIDPSDSGDDDPPIVPFQADPRDFGPLFRIIAVVVAIGLVIGFGRLAITYAPLGLNWFAGLFERKPEPSVPSVVEVTKVVERVVPGDPPTPEPVTLTPVVIVEEVEVVVTETYPPITDTPRPTATIMPLSFQDDFSELDEKWTIISGNPIWTNGVLTTDSDALLCIGDPNWTDYIVEYNVNDPTYGISTHVLVGVRADNPGKMIAFRYNEGYNGIGDWLVIEGGKQKQIPDSELKQIGNPTKITLRVEGNKFTAISTSGESSFFNPQFEKGNVCISLKNKTVIDNFTIKPIN